MSEQLRSQLGNRLRELREKHGFTQQQLAQAIGKSWETISNFERGKTLPSLVTLEQLAGLLRLSMRDFFDNRVIEPSISDLDIILAELRPLDPADKALAIELLRTLARARTKA
jgi:transcriptional regulator with XRE-family HTH domain